MSANSAARANSGRNAPADERLQWRSPTAASRRVLIGASSGEVWQDLALVEAKEPFLVGPDLVDVDVIEARVGEATDGRQVALRIRAAHHGVAHVLLAHVGGRGFELLRDRQLGHERASQRTNRPPVARGAARLVLRRRPARGDLTVARAMAARVREGVDQASGGLDGDQAVARAGGEL